MAEYPGNYYFYNEIDQSITKDPDICEPANKKRKKSAVRIS